MGIYTNYSGSNISSNYTQIEPFVGENFNYHEQRKRTAPLRSAYRRDSLSSSEEICLAVMDSSG